MKFFEIFTHLCMLLKLFGSEKVIFPNWLLVKFVLVLTVNIAFIAFKGFILGKDSCESEPYKLSLTVLPVLFNRCLTSSGVKFKLFFCFEYCCNKAAAPATCGVAMLVPEATP